MALPLMRSCNRPVSLLLRCYSPKQLSVNLPIRLSPIAAATLHESRLYSSEPRKRKGNQRLVTIHIPNPFRWLRNKIFIFLIRTYFDREFDIDDFTNGTLHAFCHVSRLLSQGHFEALEGLATKDVILKVQKLCAQMPVGRINALAVDQDDVIFMKPINMNIYYNDERKFVRILMGFWYMPNFKLPEGWAMKFLSLGVSTGKLVQEQFEQNSMLRAFYEFQREYTDGVAPDWIITDIKQAILTENF
ncbi:hypothetical protein DNTS_028355 [Danionella cerebrum]|uniref:Tim44-like domain-containing protein n=1 Tax=Danionella cerebrum TaxID=2873325 RepID=A0A553QW30_9TELE|nr:hypothetical protein DNTS_028355 [Danionella translucida]